jgi:acetyl esterase/lipase
MRPHALILSLVAPLILCAGEKEPPKLPPGATFTADIAYLTNAHMRQRLDLGFFSGGPPRPLLVWIHGGAFAGGDKAENEQIWDELMERGFAVATVNYRLSGDAKWPAQITDCKAAIRFLRAHARDYNLAPGQIGVWGSSAGGHLAALVGTSGGEKKFDVGEYLDHSSAVQCVIDLFGPIDFEKMPRPGDPNSPEARMWGRPTAAAPDLAREANPLTYISEGTPPFLIFHGDADTVISIDQSRLLQAALQKAGAPSEFIILPGVGHSHVAVWQKERERICAFFSKYLRSGSATNAESSRR